MSKVKEATNKEKTKEGLPPSLTLSQRSHGPQKLHEEPERGTTNYGKAKTAALSPLSVHPYSSHTHCERGFQPR